MACTEHGAANVEDYNYEVLILSYICYSDPPVMSQDHFVY